MWTQLRYGNSGLRPSDGVDPLANTHGARYAQQIDSGIYSDPQSYQRYAEGVLSWDPPEVPAEKSGLNRDWGRRRLTAQYEGNPTPNHSGMINSAVHTDQRPSYIYNREREFDARWSKFQKLGDNLLADQVPTVTSRERIEAERFNPYNIRLPEDDKAASPLGLGVPFRGGAALATVAEHHGRHARNALMTASSSAERTFRPNQTRGIDDYEDYHIEDGAGVARSASVGRPAAPAGLARPAPEHMHDPSTTSSGRNRDTHLRSIPREQSELGAEASENIESTRRQYAKIIAGALGRAPHEPLADTATVRVVDARPHSRGGLWRADANEHEPMSGELGMSVRAPNARTTHQPASRLTVTEHERRADKEAAASGRRRATDTAGALYARADEGLSDRSAQELSSRSAETQRRACGHRIVRAEGSDGLLLSLSDGRLIKFRPSTLAQLAREGDRRSARPQEAEHKPLFSRGLARVDRRHRLQNIHVEKTSQDSIASESFVAIPHAYEPGKLDTLNVSEPGDESCMRSRTRQANYQAGATFGQRTGLVDSNDASELTV